MPFLSLTFLFLLLLLLPLLQFLSLSLSSIFDASSITGIPETQSDRIGLVREMIGELDTLCDEYKVEKIKVDGTMMMAGSGVPVPGSGTAVRALTFALACVERFASLYPSTVVLRIGINHGKVVAGVIGSGTEQVPTPVFLLL